MLVNDSRLLDAFCAPHPKLYLQCTSSLRSGEEILHIIRFTRVVYLRSRDFGLGPINLLQRTVIQLQPGNGKRLLLAHV